MKNSINDLRNHLFDVLERLKDPDPKSAMDTETAEAICLVAKRLLESADLELTFAKQLGDRAQPSEFLRPISAQKRIGDAALEGK